MCAGSVQTLKSTLYLSNYYPISYSKKHYFLTLFIPEEIMKRPAFLRTIGIVLFLIFSTILYSNIEQDSDMDGISDAVISDFGSISNTLNGQNDKVKIGIVASGSNSDLNARLKGLGYTNITFIQQNSDLAVLSRYDLIILAANWANKNLGDISEVLSHSTDYKSYVKNGGRLYMEQPNPFSQVGDSVKVTLLPEPITFFTPYNTADTPMVVVDSEHYITKGLYANELPFPADGIKYMPNTYKVLVKGRVTQTPSLFIKEEGKGRILVHLAHSSPRATIPFSDAALQRMIEWVTDGVTSIANREVIQPNSVHLKQNYPNPFNPSTTIGFTLSKSSNVEISIYSVNGKKVKTLAQSIMPQGYNSVLWNGTNSLGEQVGSGVYIYQLKSASMVLQRKMLLVR